MKTQGKVWLFFDSETKAQSKPFSLVQAQAHLLTLNPSEFNKFFLWTPGWDDWICIKEFLKSEQKYFVVMQPPKPPSEDGTGATPPPHPGRSSDKGLGEETLTATHNAPSSRDPDSPYTQVVAGEAVKPQDDYGYFHQDFNGDDLDLKKIAQIKADPTTKKKITPREAPKEEERRSGSDRRKDARHNFKIEVVLVSKARSFRTYSRDISLSGTQLEDEIPKDFLNQPFDLIIVNPFERDPAKARLLFRAKIVGDMTDPRRLMFIEQDVAMTLRLDALLKAYVAYQAQIRKTAG
ncbi:PilZ domain-containing protein [Bdellovibrio svalbardensis]|uniref:PilZ domain-containing protein n=1 Tax=Bdellovibrio svalbardensis TaxID=2972972 RepID=A0ABT6DJV5_9BACT|nr:PilZ domain-containing protein [Bdellovibrio svalbardensis]MDG0817148.1 PilZ domain-containing protein [Bdellovibrio svalbardensis]